VQDFSGFAPREIFSWSSLLTLRGLVAIVGGGFLVGFGTAYAGGCTSGHAISGLLARVLGLSEFSPCSKQTTLCYKGSRD